MAAVAPGEGSPEARAAAVALLEPDLHGLLQRKEVGAGLQARLALAGVKSLSRYAALADTREAMREFCRGVMRMDPAGEPVEVAAIIDSWEASRTRMEARHKAEAEASNLGMPMAVNRTEAHDLKRKFEQVHYLLDDKSTPANSTLEQVFDQVEHGEWRPLLLVQFLSREDAEVEPFGAVIDKTGSVKIKKGYAETAEPRTPEELRSRLKLVCHTYIMAAMKYPQKATIQGLQPHHFQRYADYLRTRFSGSSPRTRTGRWWRPHRSHTSWPTSTR